MPKKKKIMAKSKKADPAKKKRKIRGMSKKDSRPFKKLLIKAKIDLFRGLSGLTNETLKQSQRDASGDLSGYTYHMADMASDVYERDFLLQLAAGEREHLFKIDEALKRIEEGEYGICLACGKKISKARLKVIPQAYYCHDCQEKQEKDRKKR